MRATVGGYGQEIAILKERQKTELQLARDQKVGPDAIRDIQERQRQEMAAAGTNLDIARLKEASSVCAAAIRADSRGYTQRNALMLENQATELQTAKLENRSADEVAAIEARQASERKAFARDHNDEMADMDAKAQATRIETTDAG